VWNSGLISSTFVVSAMVCASNTSSRLRRTICHGNRGHSENHKPHHPYDLMQSCSFSRDFTSAESTRYFCAFSFLRASLAWSRSDSGTRLTPCIFALRSRIDQPPRNWQNKNQVIKGEGTKEREYEREIVTCVLSFGSNCSLSQPIPQKLCEIRRSTFPVSFGVVLLGTSATEICKTTVLRTQGDKFADTHSEMPANSNPEEEVFVLADRCLQVYIHT
jgi:hypothetical protein